MSHRIESCVEHFVVHGEKKDIVKVGLQCGPQGLMILQVDVAFLRVRRSVRIGRLVGRPEDRYAVRLEAAGQIPEKNRLLAWIDMFEHVNETETVNLVD